eukprot:GHVH01001520.1.p1 GENE.GHVH01001520.1~~GHVH01001520.1.p1  ORF type:complete len:665 (+),score=91.76 GHVH01001520.1:31-2025(+)
MSPTDSPQPRDASLSTTSRAKRNLKKKVKDEAVTSIPLRVKLPQLEVDSLPSNICPLGAAHDLDLSKDLAALTIKHVTRPKTLKKMTKTVESEWSSVYSEGVKRLREAITATEHSVPPEVEAVDGTTDQDISFEDGGAELDTAMQSRLIRKWMHPQLASALKREIKDNHSSSAMADVDLRCILPNNSFCSFVHPSVGYTEQQGDAKAGCVAIQKIEAGSLLLIEDSLFPLSLEADERALCEQVDVSPELFDSDPGPVDLLSMARSIVRFAFRRVNGQIQRRANLENRKQVKKWLSKLTDLPPVVSDIEEYPGRVSEEVPSVAGSLVAFSRLYPRSLSDTKSLKKQYQRIENESLNNWMVFYLAVISMLMNNIFGQSNKQVDCSAMSVYFRLKLNGLNVQSFEEQMTAGALSSTAGSGIFAISSLINHSCRPNVNRSTICNTMILTASRDIDAGQPIFLSYLPLEDLASTASARALSLNGRDFQCRCYRCVKGKSITEVDITPPEEHTLLLAYQEGRYLEAFEESINLWNQWNVILKSIDDSSSSSFNIIPFKGVKTCKYHMEEATVYDETLLFSCGHILRSSLLLKINSQSDDEVNQADLQAVSHQSLAACARLSKGLYGGTMATFLMRWLLELSGDFYAPVPSSTMGQIKLFIAEEVQGSSSS